MTTHDGNEDRVAKARQPIHDGKVDDTTESCDAAPSSDQKWEG